MRGSTALALFCAFALTASWRCFADAAKTAGMKYAILDVKHTGGCGLWLNGYTGYDIARIKNRKNGKGDIVKELCEALGKRGIEDLPLLFPRRTTTPMSSSVARQMAGGCCPILSSKNLRRWGKYGEKNKWGGEMNIANQYLLKIIPTGGHKS